MTRKESILDIEFKEEISKIVIKGAFKKFNRPTVVWSAGKDSTVALHLVKKVTDELNMKLPPAMFIDHSDHFQETLDMLKKISEDWGFKVIMARNDDVINNVKDGVIKLADLNEQNRSEARRIGFEEDSFEYSLDTQVGNHLLKTVAMNNAIARYRFNALVTGVRWDENTARSTEVFISSRENPEHVRVQPILPFMEKDVWTYIFDNNLPIHPKYKEGFRSIDGIHDSTKQSDLPAWEQDLENTGERAGRSQDKEGMMEKLRSMGYM